MQYAEFATQVITGPFQRFDLLDGRRGAQEVAETLARDGHPIASPADIIQICEEIARRGFLDDESYRAMRRAREREFQRAKVRPAFCAGMSYPQDTRALKRFLAAALDSVPAEQVEAGAASIVVPHIDLTLGAASYAPAYHALRETDADVFVIFATSHYGNEDLFILTDKDFTTPLGRVKNDAGLLQALRRELPFGLQGSDIAHRPEHSIEFQLLFLQHCFGHRPFTILPILVSSFQPFVEQGLRPHATERFSRFIDALQRALARTVRKAAFIASADMAHIGRKFGDDFDAEPLLDELRREDQAIVQTLLQGDSDAFFDHIAAVGDRRRICGLPPVYSMLATRPVQRGVLLDYQQWNERERGSAVSYASLAMYS